MELSDQKKKCVEILQDRFTQLYTFISTLPKSREQSIAITHLETGMLWTIQAINSMPEPTGE